jgi:hypothetical protein
MTYTLRKSCLILLLDLRRRLPEQPAEPTRAIRRLARLHSLLLVLHEAQRAHTFTRHGASSLAAFQTAGRAGRVNVATVALSVAFLLLLDGVGGGDLLAP